VLNQLSRGKIDEDMLKNLYNRYSVQSTPPIKNKFEYLLYTCYIFLESPFYALNEEFFFESKIALCLKILGLKDYPFFVIFYNFSAIFANFWLKNEPQQCFS